MDKVPASPLPVRVLEWLPFTSRLKMLYIFFIILFIACIATYTIAPFWIHWLIGSFDKEFSQRVSVFTEDKMIVAKQEIISSTYSQKIDGIFEKETAPSPRNGSGHTLGYPNDYQKCLAREALEKLKKLSPDSDHVKEFETYLKNRGMNDVSGVNHCKKLK